MGSNSIGWLQEADHSLVYGGTTATRSSVEAPATLPNVTLAIAAAIFISTAFVSLRHITALDYSILHFINRVSRKSWLLDMTINDVMKYMITNLVIMALVCYTWFETDETVRRGTVLAGVVIAFAGGMLSRGLQLALPTHLRPMYDPALGFVVPYGVVPGGASTWSSFPSDHAAVFFGLATVVFLMNRRAGYLAFILAALQSAARVYGGIHHPTDVLGGAALGMVLASLAPRVAATRNLRNLVVVPRHREALFYSVAAYLCFGVGTLFQDQRDIASQYEAASKHFAHSIVAHQPARNLRASKS